MQTGNEGREWIRLQCRKTLGSSCRRVAAWEVRLTPLRRGQGCGETQAALSTRVWARVLQRSNEGLIEGPNGAEVMEFRVKGGTEGGLAQGDSVLGDRMDARRRSDTGQQSGVWVRTFVWRFRSRAQEGQCPGLETQLLGGVTPGALEYSWKKDRAQGDRDI